MIDQRFVLLAALVTFIGIFMYALSTFKGKTKPNKVTWILWTIIPFITFFAQLSEGVGWVSLFSLAYALGPLLVVVASFTNKKAYWKVGPFDIVCGIISLLALLLWWVTGNGLLAIIFSIVADFAAGFPTLIKSYKAPESESISAYIVGVISGLITLATIQSWTLATYLFPAYIVLNSLLICLTIKVFSKFKKA